jgi:hypothetical protein
MCERFSIDLSLKFRSSQLMLKSLEVSDEIRLEFEIIESMLTGISGIVYFLIPFLAESGINSSNLP